MPATEDQGALTVSEWNTALSASELAGLIRGSADARRMLRWAAGHARGWLTPLSNPGSSWESLWGDLGCWTDPARMRSALYTLNQFRDMLEARCRAVGDGGLSEALRASRHMVPVVEGLAAIKRAVERHLSELEADDRN